MNPFLHIGDEESLSTLALVVASHYFVHKTDLGIAVTTYALLLFSSIEVFYERLSHAHYCNFNDCSEPVSMLQRLYFRNTLIT